jgi:hypothetical protein
MARPYTIVCPHGHGEYGADAPDEECPACADGVPGVGGTFYLVVRCASQATVEAVAELLKMELSQRDYVVQREAERSTAFYTAADMAEDASRLTVITLDPETEADDGES